MGYIRFQSTILHFAVSNNAEKEIIDVFLKVYPLLSELKDEFGDLALHIAVRNALSPVIVHTLLQAYPSSGNVPDRNNRLPIQLYMHQFAAREAVLTGDYERYFFGAGNRCRRPGEASDGKHHKIFNVRGIILVYLRVPYGWKVY